MERETGVLVVDLGDGGMEKEEWCEAGECRAVGDSRRVRMGRDEVGWRVGYVGL